MKKRWTSLFLALVMALSLCAPALAAENAMDNFTTIRTYENNFSDVVATDWFYGSVKTCYEYGLMEGSRGKFNPNGNLTVAQALVMADRVHSIYTTGKDELKNGTPWYQPYVDYALANGIVAAGDYADYNAEITRAQMADVFSRALPAKEFAAINDIRAYPPDVNAADPHSAAILTLYQAGIVTGNDAYGTFRPNDPIARREAAAIIARVAILSQRKSFCMMQNYQVDGVVTAVAPAGYQLVQTEPGTYELNMDIMAMQVLVEQNAADPSVTILGMPVDSLAAALVAGFEESLPGSVPSTATATVYFGAIPAYRIDYWIEMPEETYGTLTTEGHTYIFYVNGTLYMVTSLAAYPGTEAPAEMASVLKSMVNRLTVGGAAVSAKLS